MPAIDVNATAVLIMDYQNEIVANFASGDESLVGRAARVLDGARQAGIPIIHVVVQFRPGYPEVADRGTFKGLKDAGRLQEGSAGAQIHPGVAPQAGDVVVTKRRVGAFSGSDLEYVLRGQGRDHLVMFGIATSGVVLTTVRRAADLDFGITVLADCCADRDEEVHRVLLEKILARQATVITADEFLAALPKR
ncbi:MAG: isochorismatase family cysteine hydrolase [Dehalococcoidia bacterium]